MTARSAGTIAPGLGRERLQYKSTAAVTKSKQCSASHAQSCSVAFFLLPLGRPLASVFPHHRSRSPFLRLAQVNQVQDSPSTKTKIQVTSFLANLEVKFTSFNLRKEPSRKRPSRRKPVARSVVAPTDDRRRRRFRVARGRQIVHLPTALQWPHTDDAKEGSERQHFSCPNSDNSDSEWGLDLISRRSQPKMGHTHT